MTSSIHARRGANLLLSKRLYYPNFAEFYEAPVYKIIEPRLWNLPVALFGYPGGYISTAITKPISVIRIERQTNSVLLSYLYATNNHWISCLIPNLSDVS